MIRIEINTNQVAAKLRNLAKQVAFAQVRALTMTARDAQAEIRRELPQKFTLRNRWVEQGIRIIPATRLNPVAVVGSRDDFMARQELGGVKAPLGGRHIAVPVQARRNKRGIILKGQRPRAILAGKAFLAPLSTSKGPMGRGTYIKRRAHRSVLMFGTRNHESERMGIWQRVGAKRTPIRLLYALPERANVRARWNMREAVRAVVRLRFERNYAKALGEALRSVR